MSPAQIQAVKNINRGPRNSKGQEIAAPAVAVAKDHVTNIAQGYAWDGGCMATAVTPLGSVTGIGPEFIGRGPGSLPVLYYDLFGYADLSPPQPTFDRFGFNFDTDLGMLNPNSPIDTYADSLDIGRFVDYGHKIIWFHGLSDPVVPVLANVKYYEETAQQFGGLGRRSSSRASTQSRIWVIAPLDGRPTNSTCLRRSSTGLKTALLPGR